jgi:hypothetical protein
MSSESNSRERRHEHDFDFLFTGVAMSIVKGGSRMHVDVHNAEEAEKLGVNRKLAENVFLTRPGRSCHLIYSRWRWSGFKCDDDTCENNKSCVLHSYEKSSDSWKPCPSPGMSEDVIYACFCV